MIATTEFELPDAPTIHRYEFDELMVALESANGSADVFRYSLDEYHELIDRQILIDGEKVELLDGYLVNSMSRNPPHDAAVDLFRAAFASLIPAGYLLRSQQAITLAESEPEPDFAVVRGNPRTFSKRHPGVGDISLVVEVSDSSLVMDRDFKQIVYARNRLTEYWIINIVEGCVEVYKNPQAKDNKYIDCKIYTLDQSVPFSIDGKLIANIPVQHLLP